MASVPLYQDKTAVRHPGRGAGQRDWSSVYASVLRYLFSSSMDIPPIPR